MEKQIAEIFMLHQKDWTEGSMDEHTHKQNCTRAHEPTNLDVKVKKTTSHKLAFYEKKGQTVLSSFIFIFSFSAQSHFVTEIFI